MKLEFETISLTTESGQIALSITKPDIKTNQVAILCPGFLDSKDYAHLVGLANDLAEIGYTVVRFDAAGIWQSSGGEYTTTHYLQDLKAVLDYILQDSDFTKVLLGGHSKGGFVALYQACFDPRITTVLAIMSTFPFVKESNGAVIEKWKNSGKRLSTRDLPAGLGTKEFVTDYSYVADRLQYDLLAAFKNCQAKLIFVAGSEDKIALASDVKSLFDQTPEPKEFIVVEGIGHDYRKNPAEISLVNKEILKAI